MHVLCGWVCDSFSFDGFFNNKAYFVETIYFRKKCYKRGYIETMQKRDKLKSE
jgi:hypothetical protein